VSVHSFRRVTWLVSVLFLAAEIFAFTPQLHGHRAIALGDAPVRGAVAPAGNGARVADHGSSAPWSPATQDECGACRIASLAFVAQAPTLVVEPLPRPAERAVTPVAVGRWLTVDSATGRAPPRA
jgi:hypothetical protein